MKTELDKFYGLIEEIKVARMTTRRPDGHLESRAMANQKQAAGADLWSVTAEGTGKLRDIARDPHVNLVLIGIDVHAAVFLEVNKPKPVVLFELAKGWLTGARVEAGETHTLTEPHR
jgi:general stress protein 26